MKKRTKKTIRGKKDNVKQPKLASKIVQSKAKTQFHAKQKLNISKIIVNTDSKKTAKRTHAATVLKTLEIDNFDEIESNIVTNDDNNVSICLNNPSFKVKKSSKKGSEKENVNKKNFLKNHKQNLKLEETLTCMNNKLCVTKKNGEPFSSILAYVENTAEKMRIKTDKEREQYEMNDLDSFSNDTVKTEIIQHALLEQPQEKKINEKLETVERTNNEIQYSNERALQYKDVCDESLYLSRSEIDYKILLKIENTNEKNRSYSNELKQVQKKDLSTGKSRIFRLLNRAKENILVSGLFLKKNHTNKYLTEPTEPFITNTKQKLKNTVLNKNSLTMEQTFTQEKAREEIKNQNTYKIETNKIKSCDSSILSENDIKNEIHDISQVPPNVQNLKIQGHNNEINDYLNIFYEERMNTDSTRSETGKSCVVLNETEILKTSSSVGVQTENVDFEDSKNCISGCNQYTNLEKNDSRINIITQNMPVSKNKRKKRGKNLHNKNTLDFLYRLQLLLKNVNIEFFQKEEHLRLLILEYKKLLSEIKNDQCRAEYFSFFEQIVKEELYFDNNSETCCQKIKMINNCQLFQDFGKPEIKIIFYEQQLIKLQETINEIKHINNLLLKSESNDHKIIHIAAKDDRSDETSSSHNTLMRRKTENPATRTINETILNPDLGLFLKNLYEKGNNEEIDYILQSLGCCDDLKVSSNGYVFFYDSLKRYWVKSSNVSALFVYFQKKIRNLSKESVKPYLDDTIQSEHFRNNLIKATSLSSMGHLIEKYKIAFTDDSFVEKLNKNGNEVPFRNVIINLKSFEFTEKTSYNNIFTHTINFDYDQQIKSPRFSRFIKNIMPKKKDRAFLFYTLSKCISYDTDNSVATWFTGKGKNGISVLMFLFQEIMGQFCVTRTHSIFNHLKINKENKNLNDLYLKRACIIRENFLETFPEEGFTKLTGCDKIIFDKNDKTKDTLHQIKTKFLFISRTPPNTTKSEFIFSKIRILHFPVSFVDNPSNENEKKIDRLVLSKLNKERHKIAFMNILLKYYKKYHSINSKNFDDRDYFIHNIERRKDFTSFLDEFMRFEKGWGTTNEAIWELFKHFKKGDIQIKRDEIKKRIENYIHLTIFSENYAKGELVYVNKRITTEQEININSRSIKIDMKKGEQQSAKKTRRMWLNLRITYNNDQ